MGPPGCAEEGAFVGCEEGEGGVAFAVGHDDGDVVVFVKEYLNGSC